MTKILHASPDSILEPGTGSPRFGTYRGGLPPVFLGRAAKNPLTRIRAEKRWIYVVITTDEIIFAAAIVRLGYAANAFAFVIDRKEKRALADHTAIAPVLAASVNERAGEGHASSFDFLGAHLSLHRPRGRDTYDLEVGMGELKVEASLSTASAPPAIGVVAELPSGLFSTTEKGALLDVRGALTVGTRRFSLDGGLAGYDYTHGLLERRTAWRWAFGQGRAKDGSKVAFNLTEGFVGERECVAWIDGDLHLLGPVGFSFSPSAPMRPWQISAESDALALDFDPIARHEENKNLVLVKSRFLQVNGHFRGRIAVPGRESVALEGLPGVTEDQDTLW